MNSDAIQTAMSMVLESCKDDFDLGWNSALIELIEILCDAEEAKNGDVGLDSAGAAGS